MERILCEGRHSISQASELAEPVSESRMEEASRVRDSMSDKKKTKFSYIDPTECSYKDTVKKDRKLGT